ncbi:MAG: ankyrin repeat domain-containing protein, partial [Acidimicrobiales bacterium]
VQKFHPRPDAVPGPTAFRLSDAQLVLARRYGFPSWAALRRRVAVVAEHGRSPHLVPVIEDDAPEHRADRMLRLGCLVYGGDDLDRHSKAADLLAAAPGLAERDIWTAAGAGNAIHVCRLLADDATLVNCAGGPFGWVPLLYLTYSRIHVDTPMCSPLRTADVLLTAGADPDAGYLWDGTYPFTALTGALGGGEDKTNQPPHRDAQALARLLLEAGADPNDSQALYNRQFDPDDSHLRLLIEFGLGKGRGGPWHTRLNSSHGKPAQLLEDQLSVAASENRPEWARLALDAGAAPDGKGTAHPIFKGRTPHELAVHRGNREVADILLAAGAAPMPLDPVDAFLAACMAMQVEEVERIAAEQPALVAQALARRPHAVADAAGLGRPELIHLLARVGFGVNVLARNTPLHQAAYHGDVAVVRALLQHGADHDCKDRSYGSPPLAWAEHARQDAVIEILQGVTTPRLPDGSWSSGRPGAPT